MEEIAKMGFRIAAVANPTPQATLEELEGYCLEAVQESDEAEVAVPGTWLLPLVVAELNRRRHRPVDLLYDLPSRIEKRRAAVLKARATAERLAEREGG